MKALLLGVMMFSTNLIPSQTIVYVQPEPEPIYQIVTAEVSAYTSSEDETDDDPLVTASGSTVGHGTLACPSRLKFETRVEIQGIVYFCEDRMHQRYREGEYYDIWVATKNEAYEWGRKTLEIKVYE